MINPFVKITLIALLTLLMTPSAGSAQTDSVHRHALVCMRMIGHEILLNDGDSTSHILPIERVGNRYKIVFGAEFSFDPSELVTTVDTILRKAGFHNGYLIEVEQCDSHKVVYSYEIGPSPDADIVPCKTRIQPHDCYTLFVSLHESTPMANPESPPPADLVNQSASGGTHGETIGMQTQFIFLLLVAGVLVYVFRRMRRSGTDPNVIAIGNYRFDKRTMTLSHADTETELSGKEAELLLLLHSTANTTVERAVILKSVWGDEGDYVGRTLDVFISKLRKRLEADPEVKIVNIRGVGYKLVMEE